MKKIILATALLLSAVFSTQTIADVPNQVALHYTGSVITKPCEVSIGSTTTLDMGDLDIATLSTAGAFSPWLNYNIHFSNCDVSTSIYLYTASSAVRGPSKGNIETFATYDSQSNLLKNIGLQVMVNNTDMSSNIVYVTPPQPDNQQQPSYDMPMKFRFNNVTGAAPESGKITGVYTMTVEYY
ncbi:hypothetical protein CWS43_06890 [Rahnella sp. AA]|uniref:fimbrial protein n=1 Tax=Rahnella sp. AA TaxID=2057180 RepID=UPI000C338286|nr:fimbrial protein [Rahnella sp. AA]PKE31770.1 hypothetical protein CWS43_06890 [Rahnella sp. AA]